MEDLYQNALSIARGGSDSDSDSEVKNSCFPAIRNCYGLGLESPSAKRIRETDFEADILKREMQSLSIKDINASEQAVLGYDEKEKIIINRARGNNPNQLLEEKAFLSIKFQELDREIETIELLMSKFGFVHNPGLDAYKLARAQNKAYIDSPDFKVGFLRADRYDPKRAATRMLLYLAEKRELFGDEKLTKDICLDDLGDDGRRYISIGGFQVLPSRDDAGRMVVCFADSLKDEEVEAMRLGVRKGYFYMLNCLSEEDNQQGMIKGFVCVCWRVHKEAPPDARALNSVLNLFKSSPIKIAAFHLCRRVSSPRLEHFNQYSKMILPVLRNNGILRFFRSYYGTRQECEYTLMKYGCRGLPLREDYEKDDVVNPFHTQNHKGWFERRVEIDTEKAQKVSLPLNAYDCDSLPSIDYDPVSNESLGTLETFDTWEDPVEPEAPPGGDPQILLEVKVETNAEDPVESCEIRPTDVLLGQAPSLRNHPGNERFREVVSENFDKYYASTTTKKEKTALAEQIVEQIKREGGRFMKKTSKDKGAPWVESYDNKEMRYKVAHTFRSIVKKREREAKAAKS